MVEEYQPREHNIRPHILLEIKRDVTLLKFNSGNDRPTQIKLRKGITVTLVDDTPSVCATTERLATGPSVRIDRNQKTEIEDRFLNKVVTVPAQHLRVHKDEL